MAEQDKKKLSYKELEQVAVELQRQLAEQTSALNRINEIRDMTSVGIALLEHFDKLLPETKEKLLAFIDKIVPVPRTQEEKQ